VEKPQLVTFQAPLTEAKLVVWLTPQVAVPMFKQGSAGGCTDGQEKHCTVVVRPTLWVPQVALVFQWAYSVPVKVLLNVSGVWPNATTGPLGEPERMVMKSVDTLDVNRRVVPATAPLIVEYSPAQDTEEMVTTVFSVGMVAEPKEDELVH
jgi:hypothetical protein